MCIHLLIACNTEYANKPVKYADKMQKDGSWLMPHHVHGYKDLPVAQKVDDLRSYYSGLRGMDKKNLFQFSLQTLNDSLR